MHKLLASLITIAITAALSVPAVAGIRDPRVNQRQHHQQARVAQGVKSGELTRPEVKDIRSDRRDIRQEERQFKSDGQITKDERQELYQDQKAASQEIYQEKHDDQVRPKAE